MKIVAECIQLIYKTYDKLLIMFLSNLFLEFDSSNRIIENKYQILEGYTLASKKNELFFSENLQSTIKIIYLKTN